MNDMNKKNNQNYTQSTKNRYETGQGGGGMY